MPAPGLETRIYLIVAELFDVSPNSVTLTSSPQTIECWDSIGHLNLVLALEEEFGVKFSPDQMDQMLSVDKIIGFLAQMNPMLMRG